MILSSNNLAKTLSRICRNVHPKNIICLRIFSMRMHSIHMSAYSPVEVMEPLDGSKVPEIRSHNDSFRNKMNNPYPTTIYHWLFYLLVLVMMLREPLDGARNTLPNSCRTSFLIYNKPPYKNSIAGDASSFQMKPSRTETGFPT